MRVLRIGMLEYGEGADDPFCDPREAVVEVVDPEASHRVLLRLVAATAGQWRLTSVDVARRPLGPPLDTAAVRQLPLDRYVVLATNQLRTAERASADQQLGEPRPSPALPDDEVLQTVAETYRATLASPVHRERKAPTAAVARALGVKRHEATRLVAAARRRGMLNPARPRQPGEIPPEPSG